MTRNINARVALEHGFLLLIVVIATLAFVWLIGPFIGAILWGVIAAILFAPLNARLLRVMPRHHNLSAVATVLIIIAVAIIPSMLFSIAMYSQATAIYARIETGEIDLSRTFTQAERLLPAIMRRWLTHIGLTDFAALQAKIIQAVASSFKMLAGQAFNVSQSALTFCLMLGVMLYLTFFLLRDGPALISTVERCLPLPADQRGILVARFVAVVRAAIKGSVVVAIVQGLVGGLIFSFLGISGALLWGVVMAVFSLLPAIGTGLIWVPVTLYLFATGAVWQAVVLFLCGILIISNVDNIVRPILVGRDTRMPDYVVLIATLGGFEVMGFNGFIIGPVIAALFIAVWEIFGREQNDPISIEGSPSI
jgi:predicted PurR-regulated permease PerM